MFLQLEVYSTSDGTAQDPCPDLPRPEQEKFEYNERLAVLYKGNGRKHGDGSKPTEDPRTDRT